MLSIYTILKNYLFLAWIAVFFTACGESYYGANILVKDPDGKLLAGALVDYEGPSKNVKFSMKTDANGNANIGYVSGGEGKETTQINVSKEGYESTSLPCVLISNSKGNNILEVKLQKLDPKN